MAKQPDLTLPQQIRDALIWAPVTAPLYVLLSLAAKEIEDLTVRLENVRADLQATQAGLRDLSADRGLFS